MGEYPKRKILSGVNDMTEQKLKQLLSLLNEYYKEKSKTCEFNCFGAEISMNKDEFAEFREYINLINGEE